MSYASTTQTQELIAKVTIGAATTPNTTQMTDMILMVSEEIDTVLASKGITVPITAPAYFLNFLEKLNAEGAAAMVLKSLFPDTTGADETPAYAFWEKRYRDGIAALKDGTLIPDDVTGATSGYVSPSTYFTNNPDTEVEDGDISGSFFTRAKVF